MVGERYNVLMKEQIPAEVLKYLSENPEQVRLLMRQAKAEQIVKGSKNILAIYQPGAIGDVVMALNLVKMLKEQRPGFKVRHYCVPFVGNSIAPLMYAAGVDEIEDYKCALNTSPVFNQHFDAWRAIFRIRAYPFHE